jgi:preprotein translocase subunit SecE
VGRIQRKKSSAAKKKKKSKSISKENAQAKAKDSGAAIVSDDSIQVTKKQKAVTPRKSLSIARPASPKQKITIFRKTVQFLREVKMELKKVTWPSRKQTAGSTVVVLIIVTIIAFFLGAVDIGLSGIVRAILQ